MIAELPQPELNVRKKHRPSECSRNAERETNVSHGLGHVYGVGLGRQSTHSVALGVDEFRPK